MKKIQKTFRIAILGTAFLMAQIAAQAATTFIWNVAAPGANNWNVNGNWNPATGNPGSSDAAVFGATGVSGSSNTVNNVVSVSTAITTLTNMQTGVSNAWHVTQIPAGVTLTVSGTVMIGGNGGDGLVTQSAMVGGGTFQATGNAFTVENMGATTLTGGTILDLSGLSNFVYSASAGTIGLGISNRSVASLNLANGSNFITAGTINLDTGSSSSSGAGGNLRFGAGTNIVNVGAINIGANRTAGTVNFVTSTGGLRLRGVAGGDSDRVTTVVLGNRNTGSSTGGNTTGTLSFNGHPVDAKIATLTMGQESSAANAGLIGTGNVSFDQGTMDVTTINMGVCSGNNNTNAANGTMTVGANATLIVNSVSLANNSVPQTAGTNTAATGTINILSGGTVVCSNNITKTTSIASTGTVAVTTGTLYVQGKLGVPTNAIDNLNVTNATFRLKVDASGTITTNAVVGTINAAGVTTIDIAQLIGVTGPTTIPLIAYNTLNGTVAGNFLVTVPSGYISSLVDNSAQKRIDLSVSPSVIIVPLIWSGANSGDWDLLTSNWLSAGVVTNYTDASSVVFDDTASNTVVNLTGTFSPASMVMSNSALNYTFSGSGSISGTNSLTLKGSQFTILDNSGSNSFTGGVTIGSGKLQIGNNDANGSLPGGGTIVNNSALIYSRTDSVTNDSAISGSGSLTMNGSGTLTLTANNGYTTTTIGAGTLQVGAGAASGTLGSGSVTNNGALVFNRSDNVTVANVISGSGSVTKSNTNTLTLSGANSYGGGLTVNQGVVRLSNASAGGTAAMTVNPGGTLVLSATNANSVVLAGGTLGASVNLNPTPIDLTATPSTVSTLYIADPQNLAAPTDATEINFGSGTWHGSGTVTVMSVPNDASPDSGNGLRLRGTGASDFSGTIILSNKVKGELQTTVAGPFSPAGTGKIVLTGGALTPNTVNGTFCELNLRNQSAGSTTFGNDVEITGAGFVVIDPLGSAPAGATVTMGNLKIGDSQELGINLNSTTNDHNVIFPTATLNGGNATFSPKTVGWNTTPQIGSDLTLGNITELVSGSGFTMTGIRTLTLMGSNPNAYSGPTTNANGTLVLNKSSSNAIPGALVITGGTVLLSNANQIADSAAVTIAGGTLAMNANNDTVSSVSLTSGAITGSGILTSSSYDAQSGSVSAVLGGPATLTKTTGGAVSLAAPNTYTGNTLVNVGTLALTGSGSVNSPTITVAAGAILDTSARTDGALNLAGGQTLNGNGTINGKLTVNPGAAVSPGSSIGVLTVTNSVLLLGAANMELDGALGTNDLITGAASITYGGTLNLLFTPNTLTNGNSFKLFNAGAYSGTFATISPATPGTGLVWDTNQLATTGTLLVSVSVNTSPTNIVMSTAGNQLTLSWPADHTGWTLQSNAVDVSNTNFWFAVPGSSATNQETMTLDSTQTNVFFRLVYP